MWGFRDLGFRALGFRWLLGFRVRGSGFRVCRTLAFRV